MTITWNANGGEPVSSTQIVSGNALGELPTTTRTGYTFRGWFTERIGGDKISEDKVITEDTTFWAFW